MNNLRFLFFALLCFSAFLSPFKANAETDNNQQPPYVNFLSEYIQIPSVTGHEMEAALFLADFAREQGLYVNMLHEEPGSYNVAASLYPLDEGKPNIVLLSHIDVVTANDPDEWEYPPFSGAIEDGYVWGRGAVDNKGMTVMQLFAMLRFTNKSRETSLPFNVTLLAVSNEEKGGYLGAKRVIEDHFDLLDPAVVIGEGGTGIRGLISRYPDKTVFGISIAQKRGVWFRMTSETTSFGHGSVPPLQYANKDIIKAVHRIIDKPQPIKLTTPVKIMFNEIGKQEGGIRGYALKNIIVFRPFLGRTFRSDPFLNALVSNTITISSLNNPETTPNQIPHWASVTFDCRLLPGTDTETFMNDIRKRIRGLNVSIEIIKETSPSRYTHPDEYYDLLSKAIMENDPEAAVIPILFPANNDNNYFRAMGVPVYGILPAELSMAEVEGIHNINERVSLKALNQGVDIYENFLKQLLNDPPFEARR